MSKKTPPKTPDTPSKPEMITKVTTGDLVKGQVPKMENPPPPPSKKD